METIRTKKFRTKIVFSNLKTGRKVAKVFEADEEGVLDAQIWNYRQAHPRLRQVASKVLLSGE